MSKLIRGSLVVGLVASGLALAGCERSAPTKTEAEINAELEAAAEADGVLSDTIRNEEGEGTEQEGVSGPAGG